MRIGKGRAIDLTPADSSQPEVAICLCTYNGARFLGEQMDSFAAQTHPNWRLWVSDDGSTDATLDIIAEYAKRWGEGKIRVLKGPRKGFCANFLSLTGCPEMTATYFAWADQDDVWLPDKLSRAAAWLASGQPEQPALYCGRTLLTDADGKEYGFSPLYSRPPSFANALVQNLGSGNTMVFNQAARALVVSAPPDALPYSHDWWAYILVTGCGGRVYYDPIPAVRYRQHGGNCIGAGQGVLMRIANLQKDAYRERIGQNIKALEAVAKERLASDNRALYEALSSLHDSKSWLGRLRFLRRLGLNRQTFLGNMGQLWASMIGKV